MVDVLGFVVDMISGLSFVFLAAIVVGLAVAVLFLVVLERMVSFVLNNFYWVAVSLHLVSVWDPW